MLIVTGPQGSGNHLFSKIFALHESVFGWKTLLNTYWEGHHHEPFARHWRQPELLDSFDWSQSDFYVTSISCPFFADAEPHVPDYVRFIETVSKYCDVDICIIGRDQNILESQQKRVRKTHTTPIALEAIDEIVLENNVTFLSQELLYLYKQRYLEQLSRDLDWPIAHWDPEVFTVLAEDANRKYVKDVHEYWLDHEVARAVRES